MALQQPLQPAFNGAAVLSDTCVTSDNVTGIECTTEIAEETTTGPVSEVEEPVVDISINNVVCTFNTKCHLNLKRIATEGMNVIYKREQGMVSMKIRNPSATASIWSSGKVSTTGSNSVEHARLSCRKVARSLQRLGFKVRFCRFRVVNVLGTCSFPFGIRIAKFSQEHAALSSYEPELHPGLTYRISQPRATLKIFTTGSITVTAPCIENIQSAVEHIYPLVLEHRMERPASARSGETTSSSSMCAGVPSIYRKGRHKRMRIADVSDDEETWSDHSDTTSESD